MEEVRFKIYPYRWVVLIAFMVIIAVNQLCWITFAPITGRAAQFYGVSDLSIGFLSMIFMIVYIVISIPASWIIDTYGIRIAVGIGAALTGAFGLMRGLLATSYQYVLFAQIGLAIGQPFILNSITKVAARWFPIEERATASGLGSLAMYVGIIIGMALTPYLTIRNGIEGTLLLYGVASVIGAVIFFVLVREHPPTPPCPAGQEERALVLEGLKQMLKLKEFQRLMLVFFIGLGVFNGVTTWIENIVRPRGFSITQAGLTGGLMIIGGIIGAVIVPMLSDRVRKRVPFIILALVGATLGFIGVTFARSYWLLLTSAFVMGFSLLGVGPLGFQYGAEISYPAPEGTSNGLLLLMGQISGVLFIFGMDSLKSPQTGSMTIPLVILIALMVLCTLLSVNLKESNLLRK
ncbi:MAG: major facilitator superfamily domain-containing protein 7 [Candidatus Marinimicrobia bacterium]|nr:major facilitator superfamily domain-containing protein 7 [Candidatus Neomarinimicrobiota bacterium]